MDDGAQKPDSQLMTSSINTCKDSGCHSARLQTMCRPQRQAKCSSIFASLSFSLELGFGSAGQKMSLIGLGGVRLSLPANTRAPSTASKVLQTPTPRLQRK